MACPLYSRREQECLLLDQVAADDEEGQVEAEPARPDLCLGQGQEYLACPVFRRRLVEDAKAH